MLGRAHARALARRGRAGIRTARVPTRNCITESTRSPCRKRKSTPTGFPGRRECRARGLHGEEGTPASGGMQRRPASVAGLLTHCAVYPRPARATRAAHSSAAAGRASRPCASPRPAGPAPRPALGRGPPGRHPGRPPWRGPRHESELRHRITTCNIEIQGCAHIQTKQNILFLKRSRYFCCYVCR